VDLNDYGFEQASVKTFPNQDYYNIKFQFKPLNSTDTAYVRDINILVQVMDGLPAS
jgi:hypothetical protein